MYVNEPVYAHLNLIKPFLCLLAALSLYIVTNEAPGVFSGPDSVISLVNEKALHSTLLYITSSIIMFCIVSSKLTKPCHLVIPSMICLITLSSSFL